MIVKSVDLFVIQLAMPNKSRIERERISWNRLRPPYNAAIYMQLVSCFSAVRKVAQWYEHLTSIPKDLGSNPRWAWNFSVDLFSLSASLPCMKENSTGFCLSFNLWSPQLHVSVHCMRWTHFNCCNRTTACIHCSRKFSKVLTFAVSANRLRSTKKKTSKF